MDIFESLNSQEDGLFDLTVECLKEADNSADKAKEILEKKRAAKKAPEEEDLYAWKPNHKKSIWIEFMNLLDHLYLNDLFLSFKKTQPKNQIF